MTGEIRNPVNFVSLLPLLPAEKEFARCLAKGEFCIIGDGKLPEKKIESDDNANVVRSEVIRFFASGGNEDNPVLGSIIFLQGVSIFGDLNLIHASIPYALVLRNCHFAASVMMMNMECAALYLNGSNLVQGLKADGLTTKGDVNLRSGFSAEGEVRLFGANIGGNLSCTGGKFHNPNGNAVSADGLAVKGGVNLGGGFSAEGEVRLLGANIGESLDCTGGKFHNPNGDAFSADGLAVKGSVNLGEGFSAEGKVRLLGASIGRSLNCTGGKFHNPNGDAFSADRLAVKGSVDFRSSFSAEGKVRLLGANIGGNLSCTGGKFHNPNGDAFSADRLAVKGNVNLGGDFSAEVRLLGANIGGDLDCINGKFHNPNGHALNIEGSNISSGLLWWENICTGSVHLAYAKVDVLGDAMNSWESCKINLDGFTYNRFSNYKSIESRLRWLDSRPDGVFSPQPYEQAAKILFGMGHVRDAREILLEKERLQTKKGKMHWLRKTGRQLWDVFVGYGYRLRYTMAWMLGIVILGTVFFGIAAHYDQIVPHQPAILASAKYQATLALKEHTPMEAARVVFPVEYPEFTPLAFALDVFIPFFALHQEPFWAPASNEGNDWWKSSILLVLLLVAFMMLAWLAWLFQNWIRREQGGDSDPKWAGVGMAFLALMLGFDFAAGFALVFLDFEIGLWLADWRWLTVWYWIEIVAGWVLTSLFLLSVTGLLRPRQSSPSE